MKGMFRNLCPRAVKTRWQYLYESGAWFMSRRKVICKLWRMWADFSHCVGSEHAGKDENSFSKKEYELISNIVD
eukprot:3999212-Karenia_brevis.AAC.1